MYICSFSNNSCMHFEAITGRRLFFVTFWQRNVSSKQMPVNLNKCPFIISMSPSSASKLSSPPEKFTSARSGISANIAFIILISSDLGSSAYNASKRWWIFLIKIRPIKDQVNSERFEFKWYRPFFAVGTSGILAPQTNSNCCFGIARLLFSSE